MRFNVPQDWGIEITDDSLYFPTMPLNERCRSADEMAMIGVVHIQKTAGTTLASVLKRSFGGRHCDVHPADPAAPFFSAADREAMRWLYRRLDSVLGHDVRAYSDLGVAVPGIEYVTALRDPIERTASHYQYDVQVGGIGLSFEDWATHPGVADRQCSVIAGDGANASTAIDLLPKFAFVGRSDRFDESLVMMRRFFGLPSIRYVSKWVAPANNIKRELLSDPASLAILHAINQNDLELWDHVLQEVYPKQQAEFGAGLEAETSWFSRTNQRTTNWSMYANRRYLSYVTKWRGLYRPWIVRQRGGVPV